MQHEQSENDARRRLPDRRENETFEVEIEGQAYCVCLGFFPDTGQVGEVFLSGGKVGSQIDAVLDDASILISRCLQSGIAPADLAKSMSKVPTSMFTPATEPASPIGAALDMAAQFERSGMVINDSIGAAK
jgi:hypothetical protein